MAILLIIWVCASMALCLAFVSVAARRVPRMDEQMAAEGGATVRQQTAVASGRAKMPRRVCYHKMSVRWRQARAALGPIPRGGRWVPRAHRELIESTLL
jgi:hypothetical protein